MSVIIQQKNVEDEKVNATIDLRNVDFVMLERFSQITPMQLKELRGRLRSQIVGIARLYGETKLAAWALAASDTCIDFCAHVGFLESNWWEGITGVPLREGYVKFIKAGSDEHTATDGAPIKDGQHKQNGPI